MFDKVIYFLIGIFYLLVVADILPFSLRGSIGPDLEPEIPFFHWLGVVGALFMLSFLAYSLRKKKVITIGKPINYLKAHIFLALTGSILVLVHSTMRLAALNSIILMVAVFLIVSSGIVGKYLFSHINNLKNGQENEAKLMSAEHEKLKSALSNILSPEDMVLSEALLIKSGVKETGGFFIGLFQIMGRELQIFGERLNFWKMRKDHEGLYQHRRMVLERVSIDNRIRVLLLVKKLFAEWHKIHLPFTIILALTLAIHVAVQIIFGNVKLLGG